MNNERLNILLVEDNPGDARLVREYLREAGAGAWEITLADNLVTAMDLAGSAAFDAVLLDLGLPDSQGLGTFLAFHDWAPALPVVIITGLNDQTLSLEAIRRGAGDYLVKGQVEGHLLVRSIRYARERKRIEKRLRESEKNFRLIYESMLQGVVHQDRDGKIIAANPAAQEILGLTLDQMQNRTSEDPAWRTVRDDGTDFPGQDHPAMVSLQTGEPVNDVIMGVYNPREDRTRWIIVSAIPLFMPGEIQTRQVYTIFQDITERKQAEQALKKSEERFRIAAELASDLIYEYDPATQENQWFGDVDRTFGYGPGEFPRNLLEQNGLIHRDDRSRVFEAVERFLREGGKFDQEYRVRKKDGSYADIASRATAIRNSEGGIERWIGVNADITERKRSEASVRESEEKFRRLYELESDALFMIDNRTLEIIEVNPAAEKMYGYSREQLLTMKSLDLSVEPDRTRAAARGGATWVPVRRHRKRDGTVFPVEITGSHFEWQGRSAHLAAVRDVSRRLEAEDALRRSEENYRLLVENQTDMIARVDAEGRILFVSPSICEMFGRAEAEVLGRPFLEIMPDFDPEAAQAAMKALLQTPHVYYLERKFETAFGPKWLAWGIKSVLDDNDQVNSMVCVGRDETSRRQFEETIQRLNRLMEAVVSTIPSSILLLDHELTVLMANQRYLSVRGTQAHEIEGRDLADIFQYELLHDTGLLGKIQAVAEGGGEDELPGVRHSDPGHPDKYLDILVRSVRTMDGKNLVLVVLNDVTEAVSLREQLIQSQKMEAIGELAGGVAHDFNNNLTPILVYTNMLLEGIGPQHPMYDDLMEIRSAAERSAALTHQLLAFSRKQVFEPESFNINDVVMGMEKMIGRLIGENIELITRLDTDPGPVRSDPRQIEHAIVNLAINARDAMPQGGKLTIETGGLEADEEFARKHLDSVTGSYTVLLIGDTGSGIPDEIKSRIFEPFFTTKAKGKGTGLGLAMVYGIIRQSGGAVRVRSEAGRGTTFEIYLPRDGAKDRVKGPASPPPRAEAGGWTVLVVEDDEPVRRATVRMIGALGCRVMSAGNGEEAIAVCAECSNAIDLVVSDVVMPGMSGPELVERLYELRPEIKVLFVSGYADDSFTSMDEIRPGTLFLPKPFSIDALSAKIKQLLES